MISASAEFTDFLSQGGRTPIYCVAITDGALQADDTIAGETVLHRICTSKPGSGPFRLSPETLRPSRIRRLADPSEARLELSRFDFRWLDEGNTATSALRESIDLTCVLYAGFQGLAWADFIVLFVGVITEAALDPESGGYYSITVRSVLSRVVGRRMFDPGQSRLLEEVDESAARFTIEDCSDWESPGTMEIEKELVGYGSLVQTDTGWLARSLSRGVFGTEASMHREGQPAHEVFRVGPSHAVDVFRHVIGGSATKKGRLGLGSWLDTSSLNALKASLSGNYQMGWTVRQTSIAQDWIEQEVCAPLGAYPVDNHRGLLGMNLIRTPVTAELVDSLTDEDIVERPLWIGDYEERVNEVLVRFDGSGPPRSEILETFAFRDQGLIDNARGRIYSGEVAALGVGAGDHESLLTDPSVRRVERFGLAVPVLEARVSMNHLQLEIGDPVAMTFQGVPQLERSQKSGLITAEVVGIKMSFNDGTVILKLLTYSGLVVFGVGPFSVENIPVVGGQASVDFG